MKLGKYLLVGIVIMIPLFIYYNGRPADNNDSPAVLAPAQQIQEVKEQGRPAWLFFRTSSCPACIELNDTFVKLKSEYEGQVVFIDINLDEDRNRQLGRDYRIGYVPQTYLLNSQGEITMQKVGIIPESELREELDRIAEPLE